MLYNNAELEPIVQALYAYVLLNLKGRFTRLNLLHKNADSGPVVRCEHNIGVPNGFTLNVK